MKREYIAISIKHSSKDCIMYWGHRTQDNESRCFSGYTPQLSNCELYTLKEFNDSYRNLYPAVAGFTSYSGLRKKYKNYDTVLVKLSDWNKTVETDNKRARARRAKKGANILSKGDMVVMHTCMEAGYHNGQLWECDTDSWNDHGTELVMLKGYCGGFATEFLQKVNLPKS